MRKLLIIFILCLGSVVFTNGQIVQPSPQQNWILQQIQDQRREQRKLDNLNFISEYPRRNPSVSVSTYSEEIEKKALKSIRPSDALSARYAAFLKLPGTGIVKILTEKACTYVEDEKFDNTIKRCPSDFIRGGGQYFSFRQKDFTKSSWADIGFKGDWIFSLGIFNQGILVNLGDAPLENLSLTDKGVRYLNNFQPSTDVRQADKQYAEFEHGVVDENLTYKQILPAETGKTYALRVVAYEADFYREIERKKKIIKLYPLKGDLREDLIIAFRIIDRDSEGNITLLWRELQRKKAPVLSIPKQETNPEGQSESAAEKN